MGKDYEHSTLLRRAVREVLERKTTTETFENGSMDRVMPAREVRELRRLEWI